MINENFESLVVSFQDKQKFINEIVQYIFKKGVNLNDLLQKFKAKYSLRLLKVLNPSKQNLKKSNSHSQSTLDKSFQNNKQGININEPTLPEEFNRPAWKTLKSNLFDN
jgi:formyltetrahydrofolate hydrolase